MRLMANLISVIIGELVEGDFAQPGEVAAFVTESMVRLESSHKSLLQSLAGGCVVPTGALEQKAEDFFGNVGFLIHTRLIIHTWNRNMAVTTETRRGVFWYPGCSDRWWVPADWMTYKFEVFLTLVTGMFRLGE